MSYSRVPPIAASAIRNPRHALRILSICVRYREIAETARQELAQLNFVQDAGKINDAMNATDNLGSIASEALASYFRS